MFPYQNAEIRPKNIIKNAIRSSKLCKWKMATMWSLLLSNTSPYGPVPCLRYLLLPCFSHSHISLFAYSPLLPFLHICSTRIYLCTQIRFLHGPLPCPLWPRFMKSRTIYKLLLVVWSPYSNLSTCCFGILLKISRLEKRNLISKSKILRWCQAVPA